MNWQDAEWGPPSNQPRFPAGLQNAPVATDPATGKLLQPYANILVDPAVAVDDFYE